MQQKKSKYHFNWGDKLIEFNSLSPNGNFYYQITKPHDMYWGLFVARISFLDLNNNLIYLDSNNYANPLQDNSNAPISYCKYSKDGNLAYYNQRVDLKTINHVLVDLKRKTHKTLPNNKLGTIIKNGFEEKEIEGFSGANWIPNQNRKRKERDFLFRKIWFPKQD